HGISCPHARRHGRLRRTWRRHEDRADGAVAFVTTVERKETRGERLTLFANHWDERVIRAVPDIDERFDFRRRHRRRDEVALQSIAATLLQELERWRGFDT